MQKTMVDLETGIVTLVDLTPEEVAALPEPSPAPQTLSREAFCVALVTVGIFTEAEATEAALGTWPPKFEPALAGKSLVEKLTIKTLWQGAKTVARDAPLLRDLLGFYAKAHGLTEEQSSALGDKIFA